VKYAIAFAREAECDLDFLFKADRGLFSRVLNKIERLADDPRGGKRLVGNHAGEYSLRVGAYRIVYEIDTEEHIVFILTIKHRKHVY